MKRFFKQIKNKINYIFKSKKKEVTPISRFDPDYTVGLSSIEVEEHIKQGATNKKTKNIGKSYISIILSNFLTLFNILYFIIFLLLRSAALSDPLTEFPITNYTFVVIVTINLMIGTIQEIRSKMTIDKLQLLTEPTVIVIRDGLTHEIKTEEIVLDDVMYLSMGKEIVADCILLNGNLEVNESQITGESVPIKKQVGDVLYSGSFVTSGQAWCKVNQVGDDSQINKLALEAKKHQKAKSQILSSLRKLIFYISIFLVISGIIMILQSYDFRGFIESKSQWKINFYNNVYLGFIHKIPLFKGASKSWCDAITATCTALIGMIPSGLLMMTSAALVLGVIKLSKHNTLVQDIYCVEMLARVDVLCLDKTGTITDGTMRVKEVIDYQKQNKEDLKLIISNINFALNEKNATGLALQTHFGIEDSLKILKTIPFSSDRKYSGIVIDGASYIIGAPEFVLLQKFEDYQEKVNEYASKGYRVLALAKFNQDVAEKNNLKSPKLLAMIVIEDQIREDAYDTIKYFKENGVEVKVISGDNPITVSTICKKVGIVAADKYISLEGMTEEDVEKVALKYTVFGRVKPEQKELLVKVLKENGKTVAMTGDGVNDILALKEADCSIAMASGNDAVKSVSKIVLLDSKFSSMPVIVEEGRKAINNIQKVATLYLLKTIFVLALALLTIIGFFEKTSGDASFPFSNPTQLLMIELFVIGIPSVVLTIQPNKDKVSGKFLKNIFFKSLPGSLSIVIAIIITYLLCKPCGFSIKTTKTIVVLCATFIGIMVLYQACQPFNKIKLALFIIMTLVCGLVTNISMTKHPRIKLFGVNISEKVSEAFMLDNLFSNYIVKLDNDNALIIDTLTSEVNDIYKLFKDSEKYDEMIICKDALSATSTLTDETMLDMNNVRIVFEDYRYYLLSDEENDYTEELDRIEIDLELIDELESKAKVNLSGFLLFFSMLSVSYILMTAISYILSLINKLELARMIRYNNINENVDIDDNDDFLKFD